MSRIRLTNVVKRYGTEQVVHGVTLDIAEGEFVVLLGPSGCGKTTTLRMVAGLEDVSGGEVWIGDRMVNDVAPGERGVAMVFQNYALYPHMSVRKNMEFALRPLRLSPREVDMRIRTAAGILGLDQLMDRRPAQLSGGQRQRVAMGRAMVRTPKVFLFDEPLSNLDAKLRAQVRLEIGKLHQRLGTTVLYVTHDQIEAMTLADRIVVMHDGHVEQVGTPEQIYANPRSAFVATFIGTPAMNLIETRVKDGLLTTGDLSVAVPGRHAASVPEAREITLGVRPDQVELVAADSRGAIPARVDVREFLGNEVLLDLRIGAHELVATVPTAKRVAPGDDVFVRFNEAGIHLFNTESGKSLAD